MTSMPELPGRIDRTLLDNAQFPCTYTMPIRFEDLDVQWHVNNTKVLVLLQEARVDFAMVRKLPALGDKIRPVVGGMTIEYAHEIRFPGDVEIATGILHMGRSSTVYAHLVRQNGLPCAYALVTMVATQDGTPCALPAEWRTAHEERAMLHLPAFPTV
ncbi:acyl-CoA thioesterase [Novosphingobium malaysiense]|uniref:acyl-CoA thioesterase n=1 Tax=Novosphingobium malaysiense TaxID=1348853 RepID=UPI00069177CB|nr:thioesterase family protein [Novosphingobium malaysiense]